MTWPRVRSWLDSKRFRLAIRGSAFIVSCLGISLSGCKDRSRPSVVPIHGRVTLDNGAWPEAGTLHFLPIKPAPGFPSRAATVKFDTDGNFPAPTPWAEGDGIAPGRYKVYVECWKVPPTRDGPEPVGYAAPKYQSAATSDIEVEITPQSESETFEWDFPSNEE